VAHRFSWTGLDLDDLVQEGNLGLLAAARSYAPDRGVPFGLYAHVCVRQRIALAVKRGLYRAMMEPVSLQDSPPDAESLSLGDLLAAAEDLENEAIFRNWVDRCGKALEKKVLLLRLKGYTMQEIGEMLGYSRQRIDQVQQEAFLKLKKASAA